MQHDEIIYETVDVFTETRFGGNPLAVIPDARALSKEAMQQIAREFHYSETTFVGPPSDPSNTAQVRIFTPANEIPFAGHPNVGTAFVLGHLGSVCARPTGDVMRFEEGAGLVEVSLLRSGAEIVGARIRAPGPFALGKEVSPEVIAACVSLRPDEIATERHDPVIASAGLPFAIAEVQSPQILSRARPNVAAFSEARARYPELHGRFPTFIYARDAEDRGRKLSARMFAPLSGILEDPATGSAAAALAGLLVALNPESDALVALAIEQGVEMGRASRIEATARKQSGSVLEIEVTGKCVPVMRGRLLV